MTKSIGIERALIALCRPVSEKPVKVVDWNVRFEFGAVRGQKATISPWGHVLVS